MDRHSINDKSNKNAIHFLIQREELLQTLEFLSPFVVPIKSRGMSKDDEDYFWEEYNGDPFRYTNLFFSDKITIQFRDGEICVSAYAKGVKVSKTCSAEVEYNDFSFCLPFDYLKLYLENLSDTTLLFIEDEYFGFKVYDREQKKNYFDVAALSLRKIPLIYRDDKRTFYSNSISIEYHTLVDSLLLCSRFFPSRNDSIDYKGLSIFIDDGICTVIMTNSTVLHKKQYPTKCPGQHAITIPGSYTKRFAAIVSSWDASTDIQASYNDSHCRFSCYYASNHSCETIEFPLALSGVPTFEKVLNDKSFSHHAMISVKGLLHDLNLIDKMTRRDSYVILHFINDHLNIYWEDSFFKESLFQFIDIHNCEEDFVVGMNLKYLQQLLLDVKTNNVDLFVTSSNLVHLYDTSESAGKQVIRIMSSCKMSEDLLQRGDESLNNNPAYKEKYLVPKKSSNTMSNNPFDVVALGEVFPFKEYIKPGDFTTAFLTESSFNIIISLTNLTEQEESAIADEAFDVYIIDTDYGPFMVFKFGENLKFDFSLNILKMDKAKIPGWLQNPEETICIFVLEGSNSVVKALRYVPFTKMYDLKVSCLRQMDKEEAEVDAFIQSVYASYSILDLIRNARYHFTVPKVEASL